MTAKLSHLDLQGHAHLVDVGAKPDTLRRAVAEVYVRMSPSALEALVDQRLPKGDALAVARIAGIQGAKRTADLVPLCHPIPIDGVEVDLNPVEGAIHIVVRVHTTWRTGVEMEAMSGCAVASLALYDMIKSVDRGAHIDGLRLLEKSGGKSGAWTAPASKP